jgi:hypothetical protein
MCSRIPDIIYPLLVEYEASIKRSFGTNIFGVYIYNSITLGAFDVNKSDIDFITILNENFTTEELIRLKAIHKELNNKFKYAKKMEGMYITKEKIGKTNGDISSYIYFADNKVHNYGYYDINYVTWWTLQNKGIPINSPDITVLNIKVNWDDVIGTMNYNLNTYWKNKLANKLGFFTADSIEFSILTQCRILYSLEKKNITSKANSARYALNTLPDDFKLIVKEALRIRENVTSKSLYSSKIKRAQAVKDFINYTITYCNHKYKLTTV